MRPEGKPKAKTPMPPRPQHRATRGDEPQSAWPKLNLPIRTEDKAAIERAARLENLSTNEWVRRKLRTAADLALGDKGQE